MIKLSDYVIKFIEEKTKHVFMLPGGGCMHLVDSLGKSKKLEYISCLHEQAISIAVEAYGQHTNNIGVGLVTTGPGGTNALTGVTAAWIDSTPCMILSGQVKRSDLIGDSGVRQMGPQEVDIVSIVKPVTKYAVTVLNPEEIRYHLEKAYHLAMNGRKGPVWLDIPLDVQGAIIDENDLRGFSVEEISENNLIDEEDLENIINLINKSKRPVVLAGNGIKLAGAEGLFNKFIDKTNIPVLLTWKIIDLMEETHPLYFGRPGTLGQRGANFIIQNCDLLIILGSRLDSSLTAFNHANFAPSAKKIMVDIDETEIKKMNMNIEVPLVSDMKKFLQIFEKNLDYIIESQRESWIEYCNKMKNKYPVVIQGYYQEDEFVNTYVFTEVLSELLNENEIIVPESSGSAGEVTYQALKVKKGQKIKNAAGLGSMGFGVPYSIGSCIANDRRRTILINGDGAFQLNIQELETIVRLKLPIKIFIWNNGGYGSIMATQRNLFDGNYVASDEGSGLTLPNISKIANAYGMKNFQINNNSELRKTIEEVLSEEGPVVCEVRVSPYQITAPKVQAMKTPEGSMISKPLEDMWPYLDESELRENMLN